MARSSVIVIGAGVAGLACALELSERGIAVEVVERARVLGEGCCSWMAGGMLAPWCERATTEPEVAACGTPSIAWWAGRFPGTVQNGSLVVAQSRDAPDLARFAARTERFEWLDGDRIAALEPHLAGRFRRALFFPDEAHLDPRLALAALAERLKERGVAIRFGVDLLPDAMPHAAIVVDCRGLAARDALPDLRGVRGEMIVVRSPDVSLARPGSSAAPAYPALHRAACRRALHGRCDDDRERGSAEPHLGPRHALELLGAAYALHPAFGEAEVVEIGTDARPAFPDNLPGPADTPRAGDPRQRTLLRHGFLLSPRDGVDGGGGWHVQSSNPDRREMLHDLAA